MELQALEVSQSPEEKFREFLTSRSKPQRYTDQQRDMVRYIFSKHNHFDADQLIEEMKSFRVSRATIYRTLKKLVEAGLLREIDVGTRKYYEHDYGYPQHEHMYCVKCKNMIEFQSAAVDAAIREVCLRHQFQPESHTFVIHGICGACNRARSTKRRLDLV